MQEVIKKVLISEEELSKRIKELGQQISKDYEGKEVTMLCLLKGSVSYFSKLCENITIPVVYEFLRASSYHGATSTGDVKVSYLSTDKLEGKHIIVVEDIIDTGLTLSKIMKMLEGYKPASLEITTLLDKPEGRKTSDVTPKYIGFTIPNEFVLGFGLDWDEKYRNLPYVGVLKDEYYK